MKWLGSIAVHVVLGAMLLLVGHRASAPPAPVVTIEVVAALPDARVDAAPQASRSTPPGRPRRSARAGVKSSPSRTGPMLGDVVVEQVADRGGDGGGSAGGRGGMVVDARATAVLPVALPVAPKLSKARPAILVFPSRRTEVEDAALYIAEIIVDDEGFVVGSRLARGFGGARDAQAGAQVWRFRYSPALDDDGRPIRSTVQQKFAVAW